MWLVFHYYTTEHLENWYWSIVETKAEKKHCWLSFLTAWIATSSTRKVFQQGENFSLVSTSFLSILKLKSMMFSTTGSYHSVTMGNQWQWSLRRFLVNNSYGSVPYLALGFLFNSPWLLWLALSTINDIPIKNVLSLPLHNIYSHALCFKMLYFHVL